MLFFNRKKSLPPLEYDHEKERPVLRCSICNGEKVAGFMEYGSKNFREAAFIRNDEELEEFCRRCGIEGEIEKVY